jgi:hypothetical protein
MAIHVPVLLRSQLLPALPHRHRERLQHFLRVVPADAGVGDGDAVFEAGFAGGGDFLVSWVEDHGQLLVGAKGRGRDGIYVRGLLFYERLTFVDVTFDHDAHNGFLSISDLLGEHRSDLGLVAMILLAVAMAAVDHQSWAQVLRLEFLLGILDGFRIVIRAFVATSQNDETVLVADCAHDGHHAGLGHGEEMMGVSDCADGVDRYPQRAICAVLESDGEGQSARQLAVEL